MNHGKYIQSALNDNGRTMSDHDVSLILPAVIKWMSELIREKRRKSSRGANYRRSLTALIEKRSVAAVLSLVNHCPATSKQNKKPETRSKNPGPRSQRLFDN